MLLPQLSLETGRHDCPQPSGSCLHPSPGTPATSTKPLSLVSGIQMRSLAMGNNEINPQVGPRGRCNCQPGRRGKEQAQAAQRRGWGGKRLLRTAPRASTRGTAVRSPREGTGDPEQRSPGTEHTAGKQNNSF